MNLTVCSLVYLFDENSVYLPFSLKGPTKGKRSSYGGKQEENETIVECAVRETEEESGGVKIHNPTKVGVMTFHWSKTVPGLGRKDCKDVEVHIYRVTEWSGAPQETDAFTDPRCFLPNEIPYHEMMPCEESWFSQFLLGQTFTGEMQYRVSNEQIFAREFHLHNQPRPYLLSKP